MTFGESCAFSLRLREWFLERKGLGYGVFRRVMMFIAGDGVLGIGDWL